MKIARILFISLLGFALYSCSGDDFDCNDLELNIGDACNDSNSATENDTVTADCTCVGTPIATSDCTDLNLNIGDPCDDGDDTTSDDVVNSDCNCVGTPMSEDITYTNTVKAILDNSCATSPACHAASSVTTFSMSTYDESVVAVGFGRILGAINHDAGFSPMPKNGDKIDQDNIDAIAEWIATGTPE